MAEGAGSGDDRGMSRILDVTDQDQWDDRLAAVASAWGGVDALVNNAAIASSKIPIDERDPADFARILDVNLEGPFLGTRAVIPHLRGEGGSIVNIASVAGVAQAEDADAAYAASKAGLLALTRSTGAQQGHRNIRCNAIAPGPVASALVTAIYDTPEKLARRLTRVPLGRMAEPRGVSAAVAFLISDRAAYLNGVTVGVDGGAAIQ